jgi:hypothetical protein
MVPSQIALTFTVSTIGTILTPAQAAAKLAAVVLYANPVTDPVLGQFFGLTVEGDITLAGAASAQRTITLNMTTAGRRAPAPPFFPCQYIGPQPQPQPQSNVTYPGAGRALLEVPNVAPVPTPPPNPPPQPPYPLVDASTQVTIELQAGSAAGTYTSTDVVEVLGEASVMAIEATVDLQSPGTAMYPAGTTIEVGQPAPGTPNEFTPTAIDASVAAITTVFQATVPEGGLPITATVSAPGGPPGTANVSVTYATLTEPAIVALYSTSDLDTAGVPTLDTPIPPGAGAQSVSLTYIDPTGATHVIVTDLLGKFPAQVTLPAPIAAVTDLHIASTGGFGNSVGQITLSSLSAPTAPIQPTVDFQEQQDAAQNLLDTPLVYMPPSYFALAQQGAATPQLPGDFFVTTGSTNVPVTADLTAILFAGNTIRFASQAPQTTPPTDYAVAAVSWNPVSEQGLVTLTEPYTGYNKNLIDANNAPRPTNETANADEQQTGAMLIDPSPATVPSNAALAAPLTEYIGTAGVATPSPPPPNPVGLSGLYARTLSLALAAPVAAAPIVVVS